MCGRIQVDLDSGMQRLLKRLKLPKNPQINLDLRPSQEVLTIISLDGQLTQTTMTWGIKPEWSKSLLINAKSETVTEKRTFSKAFRERRCLVPCTGWYEWRDEGGSRKQKYSFTHVKGEAFLMAGVWYSHSGNDQLVTLTTSPNDKCAEIHNRMPVLIETSNTDLWLNGEYSNLGALMNSSNERSIKIKKVKP